MSNSDIHTLLYNLKERINTLLKISENPQDTGALRALGIEMQKKEKFEKALEYYFEALKNSPQKEVECTLIGTVYYLQEKFDNALKYFELAIELNDNYEPAYEGRNQTLLENHLKIAELQERLIREYSN